MKILLLVKSWLIMVTLAGVPMKQRIIIMNMKKYLVKRVLKVPQDNNRKILSQKRIFPKKI